MPLLRQVFPCHVTPLRFKAVQNHCVSWPPPASRCIAIASRPKANPLRAFAARLHASPSRFDSSQCHCQTMLCCSVRRHCNSLRFSAIPVLSNAPATASPLQRYASLHFSIALPRYASPREASAVLLVPKQNSACPIQFLTVRRSTSPLPYFPTLCRSFAVLSIAEQC